MRAVEVSKRLSRALFSFSSYSRSLPNFLPSPDCHRSSGDRDTCLLRFPWSATQQRAVKVNASHVRPGNVIEKSGKMYQVIDAEHKQRGRGGAMMQMELRDIDTGNKVSLRFGTEEAVESMYLNLSFISHFADSSLPAVLNLFSKSITRSFFPPVMANATHLPLYVDIAEKASRVFVEDKSFTCLYTENDTAFVIESETFEQLEVPLDVFGKAGAYLQDHHHQQPRYCHPHHFTHAHPNTINVMILLPHLPPSYNNVVTYEMHKHWLAEATILKFLSFLLVILGLNFKTSQFICGSDSWLPVPVAEGMKVWLQLYDGRALSGSIPKRVACTIKEIHASTKGPTVTPRYRRALLDNGVTVMVPSYLEIGEEIFINPQDDSYIGR
ncbi:hypothetical protein WN943_009344 [Citrus x changshan-huyou]